MLSKEAVIGRNGISCSKGHALPTVMGATDGVLLPTPVVTRHPTPDLQSPRVLTDLVELLDS